MQPITLEPEMAYSVRLAADPRLGPTDYGDDGIWELVAGAEAAWQLPGLRSCFGGRCRRVQLHWEQPLASGFAVVSELASSYVCVEQPYRDGLRAVLAYVAVSSHELLIRLALDNHGQDAWPGGAFHARLLVEDLAGVAVAPTLSANGLLWAIPELELWLSCDPAAEPQTEPAGVSWSVVLAPGETQTRELRLHYARRLPLQSCIVRWPGHAKRQAQTVPPVLERLRALNAGVPHVATGDAGWDAAIACAYAMSLRCYVGPTRYLPQPSFVFTRVPERGWSPAGDGSDYGWQWNGQVATEAYVSCPIVAACDPQLAAGVVRNYLALQQPDGSIDWKPGLAGQRSNLEGIPLLAAITRIIYDYAGDREFVVEAWPGLLRQLRHWLGPAHDRDGDGLPEWTDTIQSAFDDNPSFVPWQRWAQGLNIQYAETPDLGAYLYRECHDLLALAAECALDVAAADRNWLETAAERLRCEVEALWHAPRQVYRNRDRDSHTSPAGGVIWYGRGSDDYGSLQLALAGSADQNGPLHWDVATGDLPTRACAGELPNRVVVRIEGPPVPDLRISLRGYDAAGGLLEEQLGPKDFGEWPAAPRFCGSATSLLRYRVLSEVQVAGLGAGHELWLAWADFTREDQTQLLPLWAGIPDPTRAAALVTTITDPARFWRACGIPNCSAHDPAYQSSNRGGSGGVWMMWNTMLGEALCRYGYYGAAWELFSRIMAAIVGQLKLTKRFWEAYDNDTGAPIGSHDYLWGTVPLHLLTLLVGVQIRDADTVRLWATDLAGRRIVVRRLGVMVERSDDRARIRWADGSVQQVIPGPTPHLYTRGVVDT